MLYIKASRICVDRAIQLPVVYICRGLLVAEPILLLVMNMLKVSYLLLFACVSFAEC